MADRDRHQARHDPASLTPRAMDLYGALAWV
jgi:hypothetical protein